MNVSLRDLRKRFQTEEVLAGIDLDLAGGQVVALIGLNGAGKTTLLRTLAGVLIPSGGTIRWDGREGLRDDPELHREMVFLPDAPLLIESQTVLQQVMLYLRCYGRDQGVEDAAILQVLDLLDLTAKAETPVARLSRGQRYKTALAALLLIRPELWLLDEPFASGMDPQGIHVLKEQARAAVAAGACVVYTTQIIEIAERFCDVLLVLDGGMIRQRFDRDDLRLMPTEGPGSLGDRLAVFRERR